ncbi:hypothetical protein O1L60_01675 [Streptomyces diastatochromogenes]|nr:hypothetical protein [Streptomyces diastatochromogenes]
MSEKTFTTVLHVQLDGTPLPDPLAVRLTEGWVDASVNVPSAFQLTFSDKDGTLTEKFPYLKVGAMAVLSPFTDGRLGEPMLTGEVTAVEVDAAPGHGRYLILRGYDPGHRLLRNRRVEGYPNMTASDIVRKLAALNRIPSGRSRRRPPSTSWRPSPTSRTGTSCPGSPGRTTCGSPSTRRAGWSSPRCRRRPQRPPTPLRPRPARTSWTSARTRCTAGCR